MSHMRPAFGSVWNRFRKRSNYYFSGHGWGDATGHVTLWNGNLCSDDCHFFWAPRNGSFIPTNASLWILK